MSALQVTIYDRNRETISAVIRTENIRSILETRDNTVPFPTVVLEMNDGEELTACGNIEYWSTLLSAAPANFGVPSMPSNEFSKMLKNVAAEQAKQTEVATNKTEPV